MPGIFGLITKRPRADAEAELLAMAGAVSREDFYSTGRLIDEALGLYVGWTALAGSFSDGMPLCDGKSGLRLVFSGEDYSDPAMRGTAETREATGSEAGYLLAMCRADEHFVEKLNGMFHGVVADSPRGAVTLFNDRYGMHRLYYHESRETFYFASEAKAILAVRRELRSADPRGLGEFVACSCVLENRTIFRDVHVLPGASCWTFRNGACTARSTYFDPRSWEEQGALGTEEYYRELRSALMRTLPRYFAGKEKLGIAMTGGLDTRVILANHPVPAGSLPSYTFRGPMRDSYDVRVGRQVARVLGQPHQVIEVGQEFLREFPDYAARSILLTEGTVDVYRASDLYVSRKVRAIAPAKIVGTYGSEIVRHAVMFKPSAPTPDLFSPEFLTHVEQAGKTYATLRQRNPVTFAAFVQSPWYHSGILALEQSQLTVRSPFMDNEFVRAVYRAPRVGADGDEDVRLRLIADGNATLAKIASDRGVVARGGPLAPLVLGYREFTFKAEYAWDYGMPQPVVRVERLLRTLRPERLFLGRHKLLHFRVWYRDQLAGYVREVLLDNRSLGRPYLKRGKLEAIVEGHLRGESNGTTAIHKLLTLELLQRLLLDG